jgi:hypothetical protein
MVVHFNRLADGSFLPASYRRLDGPAQISRDQPLLAEAVAVFLAAAAGMATPGVEPARGPAPASPRHGALEEASVP